MKQQQTRKTEHIRFNKNYRELAIAGSLTEL